jgi:hypothetical protein
MPKMNLTDTDIERAPFCDRQTWFTDAHTKTDHNRYPGLRLCIAKSGKVFYLNKWDPTAGKVRQFKLGRFSRQAYTLSMAWRDAQAKATEVDAGDAMNRIEQAKADAAAEALRRQTALPSLYTATQEFLAYRAEKRGRRRPMVPETRYKYRRTIETHLLPWANTPIDELPTAEINAFLDDLQTRLPHAAQYTHGVIGTVLRWQNKRRVLNIHIPGLTETSPMADRKESGKLDVCVPWPDRWSEIEAATNLSIRACWELRWHMGCRENILRDRKWEHINWDMGTLTFDRLKNDERPRTVALSDYSLSVFRRLQRLNRPSDFIFTTPKADYIFRLDRLPLTAPGDVRHLWTEAAMSLAIPYHVLRWLNGQVLKVGEIAMLGHYGQPDLQTQRDAANRISEYIISRVKPTPDNVLVLNRRNA